MHLSHKFAPFFELLSDDPVLVEKHKKIRYVILVGGRGGAKSHALSTWSNAATFKKGWGLYFTRWTMASAEKSVIPEFMRIAENLGNERAFKFNRTQIINNETGTIVDFSGLKPQSNQSTGDSKSLSKKNVFIIEEAEDVQNFELFDKADNSIRTIEQKNIVILCLNQGHINHWIYKEFIAEKRDDVMEIQITYLDNIKYLSDAFIQKIEKVKARDLARYQHIYLAEWKRDTDGALWKDCDISPYRITHDEFKKIDIREIVVSYDPAVTDSEKVDKDKTKNTGNLPDEDGIVIGARDKDGHCYVLKDRTQRGTRLDIARSICKYYDQHDCDWVIIEKNNGGDFIPALIKTVDKYVRCKTVTATKGKKLRAQPVQAMYENGEVHHVGHLPELELEMTSWVEGEGMASPNRLDALVWLMTHLKPAREIYFG